MAIVWIHYCFFRIPEETNNDVYFQGYSKLSAVIKVLEMRSFQELGSIESKTVWETVLARA